MCSETWNIFHRCLNFRQLYFWLGSSSGAEIFYSLACLKLNLDWDCPWETSLRDTDLNLDLRYCGSEPGSQYQPGAMNSADDIVLLSFNGIRGVPTRLNRPMPLEEFWIFIPRDEWISALFIQTWGNQSKDGLLSCFFYLETSLYFEHFSLVNIVNSFHTII